MLFLVNFIVFPISMLLILTQPEQQKKKNALVFEPSEFYMKLPN